MTRHGGSERGRNLGLASLLWHWAQLGRRSNLPTRKIRSICRRLRLSRYQDTWKISKDRRGSQTRDFPSCGTVPQPTASPLGRFKTTPLTYLKWLTEITKNLGHFSQVFFNLCHFYCYLSECVLVLMLSDKLSPLVWQQLCNGEVNGIYVTTYRVVKGYQCFAEKALTAGA